ncbi:hypothetical protein HMPREF7215_1728 [Pyramidobacter piscolens W5455]|uniref:Uncharacterized protein n=1 Tax=Pyramidobacter piscolens W5455 TaxID=352165 RepID=A0ABM9ZRF4_9BACT|nr:hypothetical protein HMPREF7215_1728 [Pyramidobacter piscolens W5455]
MRGTLPGIPSLEHARPLHGLATRFVVFLRTRLVQYFSQETVFK